MERLIPWIQFMISSISPLSFDKQVPDPWNLPSISPSPSWLIPHFFLIPVLESQKDNLNIQVKCRDLPSMSLLSPPCVLPSTDNFDILDNLGYSWTSTWKTPIFEISSPTPFPLVHIGPLLSYPDLSCLWSTVTITLTIWLSLTCLSSLLAL